MAKSMKFSEALRCGLILEGDMVNPNACFSPHNNEVILGKENTGAEKDQVFKREDNLAWFYSRDYQGVPALFASTTDFNLKLKGELGYENADEILKKVNLTYENEELGIFTRVLSEDDVQFFYGRIYFYKKKSTWLSSASLAIFNDTSDCDKKLNYLKVQRYYPLFSLDDDLVSYGISPVISLRDLKPEVMIDIESKKREGAWKLMPAL